MEKFIINGARPLSGNIEISGSKNAALPLIFASLTTYGVSTLHSVPDISDVRVAIDIISSLGAVVERKGSDLIIDTHNLSYRRPSDSLVSAIRASSYLLGANLARFKTAHLQSFGGCNFDLRPIDMHISAMTLMGACQIGDRFVAHRLCGADIYFDKVSVGASVNALIIAASAEGKSRIFGYAKEPHVILLIDYLRSAGADISVFPDRIEVVGAHLKGAEAEIIPDMIEAGTFLALSLMTGAEISISRVVPEHLSSFCRPFAEAGAKIDFVDGRATVGGALFDFVDIYTEPYPGFPTDLQPQAAPLLAAFCGGRITENVWKGRFGYLKELEKFGIRYDRCECGAIIRPSSIRPAIADAPDLRGGAALIMAALFARGESVITSSEIIKRGYSDIVAKLRSVGADIEEIGR